MIRVISVKMIFKQLLQSVALTGLIPAIMISTISSVYSHTDPVPALPEKALNEYHITVLNEDGVADKMALESYITCVLLGEVSAEFHDEALKAQAVAARTYTLYCVEVLKKHTQGAVCKDYRCCQAYRSTEEYLADGGTEDSLGKVISAVEATSGEVLHYASNLICATYFASSGGRTEDALEVWGESYPYLKTVESPGEEDCGYYSEQMQLTPSELQQTLGVTLSGSPSSWFGMVKYTVGGGVDLMRIGGRLYTGVELRKLLKLRSTVMTVTATDEAIIIDTKGYGHRVGMSQHGANAMAKAGSDYRDILEHYYVGTTIHQR